MSHMLNFCIAFLIYLVTIVPFIKVIGLILPKAVKEVPCQVTLVLFWVWCLSSTGHIRPLQVKRGAD
jgi:hypothetical protein